MNLHHNILRNKKGIGTVFGMVFFILIVMIVFASFIIILNQNTGLEQATVQAKQMDSDRYTELSTVGIANSETAVLNNVAYISCTITNNGTLPTELVRLWIKDLTTDTSGSKLLSPPLILQPGNWTEYFNSANVLNVSPSDQLSFWFVTTRGNLISAYPAINQFNGIQSIGTFPGVTNVTSTYSTNSTPMTLSLNTTQPNQLIYVVIAYDDGNTLYTPTSTPTLTWTMRCQSQTTANTNPGYGNNAGDSILETFYAIMPTAGSVTINIHSTADELNDYYCSAMAFAVSNVNTTAPFDSTTSAQTSIGYGTMPQDTITTKYSNELVIGALEIDNLNPLITPGTGFGQIYPVQSSYGASGQDNAMPRSVWSEWAIAANPTSNLPVNCTFATAENYAVILDAVKLVVIPPANPVSVSPSSGPPGTLVTVSGQGFAANSQLIATFNGNQIPFNGSTDGLGNILPGSTFIVPAGSTAGVKNVTIIDTSFNYASTNFTVIPSSITVSPQTGPLGTTVTVTGSNFVDNSNITINFDGSLMTTNPSIVTASATGGFSATFNTTSDTAGVKQVLATDGVNSASASFTVIPSITLSLNNGPPGSSVYVAGYCFGASSPVAITFAGSTVATVPAGFTTNSLGFFNVSFTLPSSQAAGGQKVNATDALANTAIATFTVTPSISLSPTSGNVGSAVTVSGTGFAVNSTLTATFGGTTVTLSGTTSTNGTGSFTGTTFTVPNYATTWTSGSVQTVSITDAAANSNGTAYTVNTISQSITVAMSNAPSAPVAVNGGNPNPNTIAADGTAHTVTMFAGNSFTLSFSNSGNTRDGFNISNAFSASSNSYAASINPVTTTAYEQVQNTFNATFNKGNPNAGDTLALSGTFIGSPATILNLNVGSLSSNSSSAWSDYNTIVTFSATTTKSTTSERWAINAPYSTAALTSGGTTYIQTYYHQYLQTLSYSTAYGGSPTGVPTLTSTQFGGAYNQILTGSATGYWLDNSISWSVTNPLGGSTGTEQWSTSTPSGTVTTSQTLSIIYNHQFYLTVTGGNSPTGQGWYNSGSSATASNAWVWSQINGQSRQALTNWQLDSNNQGPVRSNTGTFTTTTITMSTYHTVNFVSTTQYYLTVSGGNGVTYGTASPTADNWYDTGSSTTVTTNWIWNTVTGQSQTAITNYAIDGTNQNPTRQYSGTLTTPSVTMSTYHTVAFASTTQYYLTVTGGNSPTGQGWYDSGSSATPSNAWIWNQVTGQSRQALTNWQLDGTSKNPTRSNTGTLSPSVTMSTYHTVNFVSTTQYYLTVSGGNGVTYGTASPTGDNWYDSSQSTTVSSNGIYNRASGTGQRVASWQIDSGTTTNVATISTVTTSTVTMSGYHTVTFVSVAQYQVTLDSGATAALASITGPTVTGDTYWYDANTAVTLTLNGVYGRSGGTGTRLTGYKINGGTTVPVSTTGTVTVLSAVSMTSLQAITTTTVTQYQVTLDSGATAALASITGPTVTGDTYWYDANTAVTLTLNGVYGRSGGTGTRLTGYKINGGTTVPVSTTGTVTVLSAVSMTSLQAITTTTVTQYQVTFTTTGLGSVLSTTNVVTVGGSNVAYSQLPYQNWFDSGTTYSYYSTVASSASGTQFALTGTSPASPISGTTGTTVTGTYTTQYQLTVTSAQDTPTPASGSWFNANSAVTESVTTPANTAGGTQYRCTGWSGGSGGIPATGSAATVTFTITGPATITWNWQIQYLFTVISAAGTPTGQATGYYDAGTSITSTVPATVNVNGPPIINYTSIGYTGTGSAGSGSAQTVTFTLNSASNVTWHWNGQMTLTPLTSIFEGIPSETPTGSPHWSVVSDSSNSTYVYVSSNTGTYYDNYTIQSVGSISGTINSVTQYMTVYSTSASSYATSALTLNGVTVTSSHFTPTSLNTWSTTSNTFTRPGGGSWTMSDLNSLTSGLTLYRSSGATIRCSEVWIVVNFST